MKRVLFGLGTGRCGTVSLGTLLNSQPATACFHELNPSSMAWSGAEMTVVSLLRDFHAILDGAERAVTGDRASPNRLAPAGRMQTLPKIDAIGDVASYYLPYVPLILERSPNARFCCLRRDRAQTIESFVEKLSGPNYSAPPRNHIAPRSDKRWTKDRIWDKCFPHFRGMKESTLAEHIGRYYDRYYEDAARFVARYPGNFAIFATETLNSKEGRSRILDFCLGPRAHTDVEVRLNRRKSRRKPV